MLKYNYNRMTYQLGRKAEKQDEDVCLRVGAFMYIFARGKGCTSTPQQ